jgi:hypothetical protein
VPNDGAARQFFVAPFPHIAMPQKPPPPDVSFNGLSFAKMGTYDPSTLPSRYHGFYRAQPNGVHLYDREGTLQAFIVANPRQGYFAVSTSTRNDGRTCYMYSTADATERWLKLDTLCFSQRCEAARAMNNPARLNAS